MEGAFNSSCLKKVMDSLSISGFFHQQILFFISLLFLILALARLQGHSNQEKRKVRGAQVMILADVSASMQVRDMGGGFDRLTVMKKELGRFIDLLPGQPAGLMAFAGSAELVSPITLDHSSLKVRLNALPPAYIQGTDFNQALRMAYTALKRGASTEDRAEGVKRILIIASDGEDNSKGAVSYIKSLSKEGVAIFTLGFGTKEGGPIPMYSKQGGGRIGYKKDSQGELVVSRFKEDALKAMAEEGEGAFYSIDLGSSAVQRLHQDIQAKGKDSMFYTFYQKPKEHYQFFVLMSLLFGFLFFLKIKTPAGRVVTNWQFYKGETNEA